MNNKRNIVRLPVDREFARMFKVHAYAQNKTMLQCSRDEAKRMQEIYAGRKKNEKIFVGYW